MDHPTPHDEFRLATTPGWGRLVRRGQALLFVPEAVALQRGADVDELFERFDRVGALAANHTDIPRCVIDWSHSSGGITFDSDIDLWVVSHEQSGGLNSLTMIDDWPAGASSMTVRRQSIVSAPTFDATRTQTDLRDGDVHAGAFALLGPTPFSPAAAPPIATRSTLETPIPADITAAPTELADLSNLADVDATLTPVGPVGYPADDTQRTLRRSADLRCPRGHANPPTNTVCRICRESLASATPRAGAPGTPAMVGVRLPDGSVVPLRHPTVVGRSPSAEAARLHQEHRLIVIDGPLAVSRTHVLLRCDAGVITVTDCGARGRTAVTTSADRHSVALRAWDPHVVEIGATIQLGGPTTLTIVDRASGSHADSTAPSPHGQEPT